MKDGLSACGYTDYFEAGDGVEAARIYRESHEAIDLVTTDILMPHFDGIELVSFIATFDKKCPIIVCSGASDAIIKSTMMLADTLGVNILGQLDKPINLEKLQMLTSRAMV